MVISHTVAGKFTPAEHLIHTVTLSREEVVLLYPEKRDFMTRFMMRQITGDDLLWGEPVNLIRQRFLGVK